LKCGRDVLNMLNRFRASVIVLVALVTFSPLTFAQNTMPKLSGAAKDRKASAAPAPTHDISGTWVPANGPLEGIQPNGAIAMPNDGKPEHQLPFTPYGLEIYKSHKALAGADQVLPSSYNDPRDKASRWGSLEQTFII
jgi:hypothetical protein